MAFTNDDAYEDPIRGVGEDATAEFEPAGSGTVPNEFASNENLGVAGATDDLEEDEDEELEDDDDEDDDDLDEDDDEDDEEEPDADALEDDDDDEEEDDDLDEEDDEEEEEEVPRGAAS